MKDHFSIGITQLRVADPQYPSLLKTYLANHAPKIITVLGNSTILQCKILALFCSVKCSGHLILKAHDFASTLKQKDVAVIGGFHSPVERECLTILLRGTRPVIICPARSINGMRLRKEYKELLSEGRLLLLSPFKDNQRRNTAELALERNRFVAALADMILVAHASPKSKTERFCRELLTWKKPLYTFESEANVNLIELGVKSIDMTDMSKIDNLLNSLK